MSKEQWTLSEVWNAATLAKEERPVEPRDYMWASELGKGVADVVLRMRGEKPTNPPDPRARRKFEAGNIYEWIVRLVLIRAGILKQTQDRCEHQYDDLVKVTGRLDFEAGGVPTYDSALESLDALELPDVIERASEAFVAYLKEKYPKGLENTLIEVKSASAFMFEGLERTKQASKNHRLQITHYLISKGYKRGVIIYICRDDLRMFEAEIILDDELEAEYRAEIAEVSRVYKSGEMPPLEPKIYYDEDTERFSKNWRVAYSQYLTKLYGFKNQGEFDEIYQPMAERWNRVLNRLRAAAARRRWLEACGKREEDVTKERKVEGRKGVQHSVELDGQKIYMPDNIRTGYELTDDNKAVIAEMVEEGFEPYELAERMKDPAPEDEEGTESGEDMAPMDV